MDIEQRAREFLAAAHGEVTGVARTPYWDKPISTWDIEDQYALRAIAAALKSAPATAPRVSAEAMALVSADADGLARQIAGADIESFPDLAEFKERARQRVTPAPEAREAREVTEVMVEAAKQTFSEWGWGFEWDNAAQPFLAALFTAMEAARVAREGEGEKQ